ncbi:MAG: hypothetical protein QOF01_2673 [Thermomicrobiales bacterium]|nr:hypothetical protein [Thermomicrobiales bacterium]
MQRPTRSLRHAGTWGNPAGAHGGAPCPITTLLRLLARRVDAFLAGCTAVRPYDDPAWCPGSYGISAVGPRTLWVAVGGEGCISQ